jgi:hypothetical protein
MFGFIKKLFGSKPAEVATEVPYKVEVPVAEQAVVVSVDPTVNPVVSTTTEEVVVKVVPVITGNTPKQSSKKKQSTTPKQPTAPKQAGTGKPRGRRPKSKPASK